MLLVYKCKANNVPTQMQTNCRSHAYIDGDFLSAMHVWTPSSKPA